MTHEDERLEQLAGELRAARAAGVRAAMEVQQLAESVERHEALLADVNKALQGLVDVTRQLTEQLEKVTPAKSDPPAPAALPKKRTVN
jgi:DNA repair ATPase RecN